MPSIFIWKAHLPNTSKQFIRCYSGSNWFLEDHDYSSSYIYLQQIVIPGYNDSVITFHVKKMPVDWVGADLLEVNQVPIQVLKSDNYGKLEHIGNWMRFTSQQEMSFTSENLAKEFEKITQWKDQVGSQQPCISHANTTQYTKKIMNHPSSHRIQMTQGTTQRTTQRSQSVQDAHSGYKKQLYHSVQQQQQQQPHYPQKPQQYYAIDEQTVHQNFKQFLDKFNINNVTMPQTLYSSYTPVSISIVSGNKGR